jgi:hypothetical protein
VLIVAILAAGSDALGERSGAIGEREQRALGVFVGRRVQRLDGGR